LLVARVSVEREEAHVTKQRLVLILATMLHGSLPFPLSAQSIGPSVAGESPRNGSGITFPIDVERAAERHGDRSHAERGNEDSARDPSNRESGKYGDLAHAERGNEDSVRDPSNRESGKLFEYIDTHFENASPLWYEIAGRHTVVIHLSYDHERSSANRAAGHIHFQLQGNPGEKFTLEFKNIDNIYNGRLASVAGEMNAVVVSQDGKTWKSVATRVLDQQRVLVDVEMPGPRLYVARVEPYRLSDLDRFLATIQKHGIVHVTLIGKTVEGRNLEIIRVGDPKAANSVFLRARAHPWESGGNWVVQGLVSRLLQGDDQAKTFLKRYCVYIMPMANKDGVAHGWTRFNARGKDLNRNWDQPADRALAPENHAVEEWLARMIADGRRPDLALELHNDGSGNLHPARPPGPAAKAPMDRMATFERLLRKKTWFTEGSTKPSAGDVFTLPDGWLARYGIDGAVHEFNCQWIAGLKEPPLGRHWEQYGERLAFVLFEYFGERTSK
jgi:Zinc carboxypeptidase